jgi:hypothetical protein
MQSVWYSLGIALYVEINWPSGLQQTFRNVDADKFYLIEEGSENMAIQKFAHQPSAAR